jgi:hypothetical protein
MVMHLVIYTIHDISIWGIGRTEGDALCALQWFHKDLTGKYLPFDSVAGFLKGRSFTEHHDLLGRHWVCDSRGDQVVAHDRDDLIALYPDSVLRPMTTVVTL